MVTGRATGFVQAAQIAEAAVAAIESEFDQFPAAALQVAKEFLLLVLAAELQEVDLLRRSFY